MTAIRKTAAAELQTELLRKSIHFFIAMVPPLATLNLSLTMALLGSGVLVYTTAEVLRLQGRTVPFISGITRMASRDRDRGRFVLGPVTLGLGAMLALMLYPEPAAFLAIYALAFGDGLASLVGKFIPMGRMAFLGGKTLSGSFACFAGVFIASYGVTGNLEISFFLALITTFLEAVPAGDLDNVIIPMGTGLAAALMMA